MCLEISIIFVIAFFLVVYLFYSRICLSFPLSNRHDSRTSAIGMIFLTSMRNDKTQQGLRD